MAIRIWFGFWFWWSIKIPTDGTKGGILSPFTGSFNCRGTWTPKPRLKPRKSIMLGDIWTFPSEASSTSFTEESRRPRVCSAPRNYGVRGIDRTFLFFSLFHLQSETVFTFVWVYTVTEEKSKGFTNTLWVLTPITSSKTRGVVADHLNICNYCLPKRADEAHSLIINTVPKKFWIEKIAFRCTNGVHAWELEL